MSGTALCERSDLPPEQCAHCRHGDQPAARPGTLAGVAFPARFAGICTGCDGPIEVGQMIGPTATPGPGGYEHVDCDNPDDHRPTRSTR